jgi:hypothetical protein
MRQLPRSDGSLKHPFCVLVMQKAMTGAPNAGYLWEQHCEKDLVKLGWTVLENEPSAYYINNGPHWTHLLRSTDDLSLHASSQQYLDKVRKQLERPWNVTRQPLLPGTSVKHLGMEITRDNNDDITISSQRSGRADFSPTPRILSSLLLQDHSVATPIIRSSDTMPPSSSYFVTSRACKMEAFDSHTPTDRWLWNPTATQTRHSAFKPAAQPLELSFSSTALLSTTFHQSNLPLPTHPQRLNLSSPTSPPGISSGSKSSAAHERSRSVPQPSDDKPQREIIDGKQVERIGTIPLGIDNKECVISHTPTA